MGLLEEKIFESNKLDALYHNYKKYSSIKFDINLDKLQNAIKDNKKFTNYDDNFIFKLSNIIDKKEIYNTLHRKNQYYHFYFYFLEDYAVIEEIRNYCKLKNTNIIPLKNYKKTKNKRFPLKLLKYSISSRDKDQKEEYIFMNKLDEYQKKLNVQDGLKYNNIVNDKLIYEYLKGINWIYQYYFEDNLKNKYWFYPFEYTPLIKDIYQYLKLKKNLKFNYKVVSDHNNFFTVLEQLLFITPFNYNFYLLDNILNSNQINKVKKFVSSDKYKKFYFDLEEIAKEILFNNKNEQIDCHNALYFNKCKLIELSKHLDPNDEFINDFRKYISFEEQNDIYKIIKIYQRSIKSI